LKKTTKNINIPDTKLTKSVFAFFRLLHQVCVKGLPVEGGVVLHSPSIQGEYRVLRRLLEQRSLLLFLHEYTRRVRLTAAHMGRVNNLLEQQLNRSASKDNEVRINWVGG